MKYIYLCNKKNTHEMLCNVVKCGFDRSENPCVGGSIPPGPTEKLSLVSFLIDARLFCFF